MIMTINVIVSYIYLSHVGSSTDLLGSMIHVQSLTLHGFDCGKVAHLAKRGLEGGRLKLKGNN